MEEIEKILQDGEEIQWKRIGPKNLLRYIYYIVLIEILFSTLIFILLLFPPIHFVDKFEIIIYFTGVILIEFYLLISFNRLILKERYKRSKALKMKTRDLKNYTEIDIITNKRLIQKNYRNISNIKKNYPHLFNTVLKMENDLMSLELEKISKIIFKLNNKRIVFIIKNYQNINSIYLDFWKFRFKKEDLNVMHNVMEILKNILCLIKIKESTHEKIYQKG